MDVATKNKTDKVIALLAVGAVVAVAGYAAFTRYDPQTGPPKAPLVESSDEQLALEQSSAAQPKAAPSNPLLDNLSSQVSNLVADERSLGTAGTPAPTSQASSAPDVSPPAPVNEAQPSATRSTTQAPKASAEIAEDARGKIAEAEALLAASSRFRDGGGTVASRSATSRDARIAELRQQLNALSDTGTTPDNSRAVAEPE